MARTKKILGTKTSKVKFIGETNKSDIKKIYSDTRFITAFKELLREFSVPEFEYTFSSNSDPGDNNCLDTGTEGVHAAFMNNLSATASLDSVGEFEGHSKITAATHAIKEGYADAKIDKRQDRTYIWVMDVEADLPATCYLNFGGTGASENAWGWIYVGGITTTHHSSDSGVFASRYLWDSPVPISDHGIKLTAATGSHSAGGTATDFITTRIDASTPRRSVFCMAYDLSETDATVRWKQTGNGAGHTYITSGSAADTGGIVYTYLAGYDAGNAPVGAKFKYIAVIDAVLTADQFTELADIALGA